ncbi:MAG: TetR family transcriptional regulator, partial [Bacillus sp. (in: Bacteria)]|nr:TetR family transcriptional regulator [Bacillus sp. (in: firmicutes)]
MKRMTAKELLAESFRELAKTKKINKITVKDITENCGYSVATFYRHFNDKYDLIAWAYSRDVEEIMKKVEYDEASWKQVLTSAAEYYRKHRDYLSNLLLHTAGYTSFVRNMSEINYMSLK